MKCVSFPIITLHGDQRRGFLGRQQYRNRLYSAYHRMAAVGLGDGRTESYNYLSDGAACSLFKTMVRVSDNQMKSQQDYS